MHTQAIAALSRRARLTAARAHALRHRVGGQFADRDPAPVDGGGDAAAGLFDHIGGQ